MTTALARVLQLSPAKVFGPLRAFSASDVDAQGAPLPPVPAAESDILRWCYSFHPGPDVVPHLQESAFAIAEAATKAPLFAGPQGPLATAAVLVALAWSESEFHPTLVSHRHGRSTYGLFQVELESPKMPADPFLLPRHAAHVAIELLRQGLEAEADQGRAASLERALSWYDEPSHLFAARFTLTRALLAA